MLIEATFVNPIQDGSSRGCSQMGLAKKGSLPKICHTYSPMMKLTYIKTIET